MKSFLKKIYYNLPNSVFSTIYTLQYSDIYAFVDFPKYLFIENTNQCNAHCTMCPRESLTRKQVSMTLEFFQTIIKQIEPYGQSIERVDLHGFGEPMLDKDLPKKVQLLKKIGVKHTHIVSNGSKLSDEYATALLEAGLDSIKFSFYGENKEAYETTMVHLNYEKTLSNINNFLKLRNNGNFKTKVIIQILFTEHNNIDERFEKWKTQFTGIILGEYPDGNKDYSCLTGDIFRKGKLHNYGEGKDFIQKGDREYKPCYWPFQTMVINNLGQVIPCIYDYNSKVILGDLKQSTIVQIWNSAEMNRFRKDMRKAQLDKYSICQNCSQFFR